MVSEHDEEQRRVEVVAEHAFLETDGGEDQPDLAARQHPEPDEQLVAGRAERTDRRDDLADDRAHEEHAGDAQHVGRDELLDSTAIPIWRKNTGMNRWPTGASSRWIRSFTSLRDRARPATNAPTIGASLAASASSANPG